MYIREQRGKNYIIRCDFTIRDILFVLEMSWELNLGFTFQEKQNISMSDLRKVLIFLISKISHIIEVWIGWIDFLLGIIRTRFATWMWMNNSKLHGLLSPNLGNPSTYVLSFKIFPRPSYTRWEFFSDNLKHRQRILDW